MNRPADLQDIHRTVVTTLAALCSCDTAVLTPECPLWTLGLDSTGIVTLAAHIESACQRELDSEQQLRLFTAEKLSDVLAVADALAHNEARGA